MRDLLHSCIAWYLRRCAGAFHVYPYGERGRYVVLMDEDAYHRFKNPPKEPTIIRSFPMRDAYPIGE